jgi:hypothetical protein
MLEVTVTFGHIDKMPKCEHGYVKQFCSQCDTHKRTDYKTVPITDQKGLDFVETLISRGYEVFYTDTQVASLFKLPEAE